MVDLTSIAAVTGSLKTAGDIAKAAIGLNNAEAIRSKVLDMQSEISAALGSAVSAYTDQLSLLERVRGLESKIADLEAWSTKKQRYELHAWDTGTYSYALKEGVQPPEAAHHVCATCFDQGKPSVLQADNDAHMHKRMLRCNLCKSLIEIGRKTGGPNPYVGRAVRG